MTANPRLKQVLRAVVPVLAVSMAAFVVAVGCTSEEKEPVVFADLNWDSAEIQTRIAGYIIEHGYEYPVENIVADTASQFPAFESESVDVSMEVWKQNALEAYNKAISAGHVQDLGNSLDDNWQAFVVPQYIKDQNPGLVSVSDIPEYKEIFVTPDSNGKARFVTCIPGWGCETVNAEKIKSYELEDHVDLLNPGSGAGLFADLEGAYARGEPWLGYLWGPTKPAYELDLYRLEEPEYTDECWDTDKMCAYPVVEVRILVHETLAARAPEVVEFLEKWNFAAGTQVAVEGWKGENETATTDDAAIWYLENYRNEWSAIVPDDVATRVDEALAEG